jgi:hypothetical protein
MNLKNHQLRDFYFQTVIFRNCKKIVNVPVSGSPVAIKERYASIKTTVEWCTLVEYTHVPIMFFEIFYSPLTFVLISVYKNLL